MAEANIFVSTSQVPSEFNWAEALSSPIAFTLDNGDPGYLLTDSQLETLLERTNTTVNNVMESNFRGIKIHALAAAGVPVDETSIFEGLPKRTGRRGKVSVIKWDGEKRELFRKLVEKILAPAIPETNINISVPHGTSVTMGSSYIKADNFNILFWSGYTPTKLKYGVDTIWGYKVECQDPPFACSEQGMHPIMDGSYCVAEIFEDALYIHHDLCHYGWDSELMIFRKILEETANILKNPDLITAAREDRLRRNVKNYIDLCHKGAADKIKELERELRHAEESVEEFRAKFISNMRKVDQLSAEIPKLSELTDDTKDKFSKDYQRLCGFSDVIDIKVLPEKMEIYTNDLFCTNPKTGLKHWMGRFKITIDARGRNGGVIWKNLSFTIDGYEDKMQAPHVFYHGGACLGSLQEIIPQYLAKWDFATLTQLAISFIQSVNVDDVAGSKIPYWPIAESDLEKAKEMGINPKKWTSQKHAPCGGDGNRR